MAVAREPALAPEETARRVKRAVIHVGAASGHETAFADAGRRLGLGRLAFHFGGRVGVRGPADADVVTAVCGLFRAWPRAPGVGVGAGRRITG